MFRPSLRTRLAAPLVALAFLPLLAAGVAADASAGNGGNCTGQQVNCSGGNNNTAQDNDSTYVDNSVDYGNFCYWVYDWWGNPLYYVCY